MHGSHPKAALRRVETYGLLLLWHGFPLFRNQGQELGVGVFGELTLEFSADFVLEEDVGGGRTLGGIGILGLGCTLALLAALTVGVGVGVEDELLALALDFALKNASRGGEAQSGRGDTYHQGR